MTALAKDTPIQKRAGTDYTDPVAEAAKIYSGAIVCLGADGFAVPGSTATGLVARGRAEHQADNTDGGDGDISVLVAKGVFKYKNEATDLIDRTDIGGTAYIVDDQTVAATDDTASRSAAGEIMDVDATGVWVKFD